MNWRGYSLWLGILCAKLGPIPMKNSWNLVLIIDLSEVRVPSLSLNLSWILPALSLFTVDFNICQVRFTLLLLSFERSEKHGNEMQFWPFKNARVKMSIMKLSYLKQYLYYIA